ncbi:hypothetical protein [Streptomyces sp. TS71-3]|uniref:hypothetical protein n=1 Tax=Streptomyces sp. TS71-3 TaxID=2733862 RepID=UPI001BB35340|nr:hypothetical protein [Streptomyces sp. TS71-3]
MEPLTEHRPVNGPVVYGYLRLINVSVARQTALKESLAEYCRQHELSLFGVSIESSTGADRAAFTGLLDVLALPGTYGVVLPAASHLGPKPIAGDRAKRITVAGSRLLLARGGGNSRRSGRWFARE